MSESKGILDDIRVLDVGTYVFGPAAATVMSDFGADVIKVEPPTGDPYRWLHQVAPLPACEQPYCWTLDGRNKRSIALNLKMEAGREVLRKLVAEADVFVTNYHASVLRALRMSYEELRPLNERLIFAHATGYGQVGEEIEKPGFDMTAYWARSGLMENVRPGDGDHALALAGMGDHPSSLALFGAVMLALYERTTTGKGRLVGTSLSANGVWANGCLTQGSFAGAEPYRRGTRGSANNALVNHYATRDGRNFILCCINAAKDWPAVCRSVGLAELEADERFATPEARRDNASALIAILDEIFIGKPLGEWMDIFERETVTFSPISRIEDLADDAQLLANDVIVEMDHKRYGRQKTIANPIFLSGRPQTPPRTAPELGEHTGEIMGEIGYTPEAIEEMSKAGTVVRHEQ